MNAASTAPARACGCCDGPLTLTAVDSDLTGAVLRDGYTCHACTALLSGGTYLTEIPRNSPEPRDAKMREAARCPGHWRDGARVEWLMFIQPGRGGAPAGGCEICREPTQTPTSATGGTTTAEAVEPAWIAAIRMRRAAREAEVAAHADAWRGRTEALVDPAPPEVRDGQVFLVLPTVGNRSFLQVDSAPSVYTGEGVRVGDVACMHERAPA